MTGAARREAGATAQADGAARARSGSELRTRGTGMPAGTTQDVRVPVSEEEIIAEKRMKQAGEVKIRKEVKTEHRQVTVPVTKEEVHVERVPARGDIRASDAPFKEGTISVPVREEEVEIRKRPVVREEVRVSKTQRQDEKRADADVRREVVHVEKAGDVHVGGTGREEPKH